MKLFSRVSAVMYGLLITVAGIGAPFLAYAQPFSTGAMAQDTVQDSSAPAIAGSWQMSFTDRNGDPRQGTLQIQQDGAKLSGTFQGPRGSAPLKGSLQGNQISITVKARGREISFTGTVDGDKMTGTTQRGTSWTATRQ